MSLKHCPTCGEKLEENAKFCNSCGADLKNHLETPAQTISAKKTQAITAEGAQYAKLGPRLIAIFIDSIIIGIIGSSISWVFIPYNILNPWNVAFNWLNNLITYVIGFIYFWGLESYNEGQTIGKLALKLRTVDETTLKVAEPGKNVINTLAKPSALIILDFIIGIFSNTGDPKKRIRILQNISNTVVISEK